MGGGPAAAMRGMRGSVCSDNSPTIKPGDDADLAIADADLARISLGDIRATQVETWVRGQLPEEASD